MRVLVTGGSGFIGTNLITFLEKPGIDIISLDSRAPLMREHLPLWQQVDIRDRDALNYAVRAFAPTHIVHLAAIATFEATKVELYDANVDGTAHILDAALAYASRSRVLVTSTQYVNGPGTPFDDDLQFHTVNDYGQSKVSAELVARSEKYNSLDWIITRPSNIWGAFHPRFPLEIWKYIRSGIYLHPGHALIERAYGYVGNVCRQMEILMRAPTERVRHRVFYLTDVPVDSYKFLNHFSHALRGGRLPRVPYSILKIMALLGDSLKVLGIKAPFHSDRLHRMTVPHGARFETLWDEFGYSPITLSEAVAETTEWLKQNYPEIYH